MRDYQRKTGKYRLPASTWHRTLWTIRDYYEVRARADEKITTSHEQDGQPRGTKGSDPVFEAAQRREKETAFLSAIDRALALVPEEYQKGVWESVVFRKPYPHDAARRTYTKWRTFFVYKAAEELEIIRAKDCPPGKT